MEWFKQILSDAKLLLICLGFACLIIAIVGQLSIKGWEVALKQYQRWLIALLGTFALILVVLAYRQMPPPIPSLPKGSVIMWWGAKSDIPPNFEICDGKYSKDLGYDKPDFTGRFARGAKPDAVQISMLDRAGADQVPLPDHQHTLPELAAGWGPRTLPWHYQFQQIRASQNVRGGILRGWSAIYNDDDAEGINNLAEFRPTAVFALGAGPTSAIQTKSTSSAMIDTVPRYQEVFYIIKVAD